MSSVATVAAVRGGANPNNEPLALRVPLLCHGHAFSSPPLKHQVAWSKHLCELQKEQVSNCKSKKWSMLGGAKHFAIGKKEV